MEKHSFKVGIIIASDRAFSGTYQDKCEQTIRETINSDVYEIVETVIVPDQIPSIKEQLLEMVSKDYDLILTSGGTGFTPRDVTPEASREVIERLTPGIDEAMRAHSFKITKHAMLSRGVSGIAKNSLIINLPGSPKAVKENLECIIDTIPHGIRHLRNEKLH